MQRPADVSLFSLRVERRRNLQRVRIRLDDRAQRRSAPVRRVDARKIQLDDPASGVTAGLHPTLQVVDRDFIELEIENAGVAALSGRPTLDVEGRQTSGQRGP